MYEQEKKKKIVFRFRNSSQFFHILKFRVSCDNRSKTSLFRETQVNNSWTVDGAITIPVTTHADIFIYSLYLELCREEFNSSKLSFLLKNRTAGLNLKQVFAQSSNILCTFSLEEHFSSCTR